MSHDFQYRCTYVPGDVVRWELIEGVQLVDTAVGTRPRLQTVVKMCRTDHHVHIRFECEDDHVVATYERRDDPLYKEDVVEIFIDEEGRGTRYKEYEVSPRNVIFDALIEKKPDEPPIVYPEWDDAGLKTTVTAKNDGTLLYDIAFSVETFDSAPVPGTEWRINFYRIDEDKLGNQQFSAWSPTGRIDFHRPETFGTVRFV